MGNHPTAAPTLDGITVIDAARVAAELATALLDVSFVSLKAVGGHVPM